MILKISIAIGRVDRAIEVWDGMEKRGFHPGAATYAIMVYGLSCKKVEQRRLATTFDVGT
jgi:pentatricopeptide repeat protein